MKYRCILEYVEQGSIRADVLTLLRLSNSNLNEEQLKSKVGYLFSTFTQNAQSFPENHDHIPWKFQGDPFCYPVPFEELEQKRPFGVCIIPLTPEKRLKRMVKNFRKSLVRAVAISPRIADVLAGYLVIASPSTSTPIGENSGGSVVPLSQVTTEPEVREFFYKVVSGMGLDLERGQEADNNILDFILGKYERRHLIEITQVEVPTNQHTGGSGEPSTITNSQEHVTEADP